MDGEGVQKVGQWGGVPGLPFMVWEQNVEYELKRIRARQGYKGVSAGMQLGHIRTRITPYTPGAMAHEAIEEALRPALLAAAKGQVTSPAAIEVPALAEQLGKVAISGPEEQGEGVGFTETFLAMTTFVEFQGTSAEDRKERMRLGGKVGERLAAVKAVSRQKGVKEDALMKELIGMLEELQTEEAEEGGPGVQLPEGWVEVDSLKQRFMGPGGTEGGVQDLPVHAYTATMRKYFNWWGPGEGPSPGVRHGHDRG